MISKYFIILCLTFIAVYPHVSIQQQIISKSNTIEAHCQFNYDPQGRYNCYLFGVRLTNPDDVLNIVGSHLLNHTDADVVGVIHRSSTIMQFNGEVFRKFVNLRHLDLRATFMHSINPLAFDNCAHLEELDIGSNPNIVELPSQMLGNCRNFRILTAPLSRLTDIPANLFGSTTSLESINLQSNRLTLLPDNLLRNMANLRRFAVGGNQISSISPSNFFSAVNLEDIDISSNIFNDPQAVTNLLHGHFGLRRIFINFNPYPMFSLSFFGQFRNLQELRFGGRLNLTQIEWQFLPSSLLTLSVSTIGEEIPENAFVGLPNLTYLDLNGYGITALLPNTFSPLTNLDRLDIMSTRLTTFHPQQFTSQTRLRALHLSFNEIEELPAGVFAPLVNLGLIETTHGLYMIQNRLRRLSASSFGQHPHLRLIFLEQNQIYEIQRGLFSRFHPQPIRVDLFGNVCINWAFSNMENIDENERLDYCFNNYEGITTTTPNGSVKGFSGFTVFFVSFVTLVVMMSC